MPVVGATALLLIEFNTNEDAAIQTINCQTLETGNIEFLTQYYNPKQKKKWL